MPHRSSFVHTKGGTGKTTAAVNVAGFMSKRNQHVLLVDADPEGHATRNLGLEPSQMDASLHDLILRSEGETAVDPRDCVYPTAYGVDVVPASQKLHDTYHRFFDGSRNETLAQALEGAEDRYDHVIIDTPSSYRDVVAAALKASHDYYLVMDSSIFAQQGSQVLKSFLRKLPDKHNVRVNPTKALYLDNVDRGPLRRLRDKMFGRNDKVSERTARALFRDRLVNIPHCSAVSRSQAEGKPLSHFDPVPDGAQVYEALAEDLIRYSWR